MGPAGGLRYLQVGGLAVFAHGYERMTRNRDLVLGLKEANMQKAVQALTALSYRPRVPVAVEDLADPVKRSCWSWEKT